MTSVRIILWPCLVALAVAPAHADIEPTKVRPFPTTAISLGVAGHAGKLAGLDVGGWGPNLELAIGSRRLQYFLETGLQFAQLDNRIDGEQRRAGLGVRWLARSFELGPRGSVDMHLEGFGGVSRYDFDGMNRITRPDLGLGVGYLLRMSTETWCATRARQVGFRVSARVFFAPTDRETVLAACRGTCAMSTANTNSGLMAVFGGSF